MLGTRPEDLTMHPVRIIATTLFAVATVWPAPSWAVVSTTAGYSYQGQYRAHPTAGTPFQGDHTTVKVGAPLYQQNEDGQSFSQTATGSFGTAEAVGSMKAIAWYGQLKTRVDVTLTATNSVQSPVGTNAALADIDFAVAKAGWRDSIVLTTSQVPVGIALLTTIRFNVEGALVASASADGCCARAEAEVVLRDYAGNIVINKFNVQNRPALPTDGSDDPNADYIVDLLVVNGIRRDVGYTLESAGDGYANRGHSAATPTGSSTSVFTSDYFNTATWGGISKVVVAASGEPIEDWAIESESGFDYSRPFTVPEPASPLLVAPVALKLLLRRRQRMQGRKHPVAARPAKRRDQTI
jgi:hypothetical protein